MTRADEIYKRLKEKGFSADNVVLGVGSYTYQMVSRDTLGYAMKATNIIKNGESIPLFKDPKTDNGTKKSAKGLLKVIKNNGKLQLIDNVSREDESLGELTTLFLDGKFMKHQSFDEIRKLVKENV
jgi:nicotinamide phosphoribosyltransferase